VNSYICTTAHTSDASTFSNDSANWDTMATGANIPTQTGNSGKVLKTDGSSLSWGDGVPDQSGNSGKVLKTDGSTLSWGQGTTFNADDAIQRFSAALGGADSGGVTQHTSSLANVQSTIGQCNGLQKHYVNGDATVTADWDGADTTGVRTLLVVDGTFTVNSGCTLTWDGAGAGVATNANFNCRAGHQNGGDGSSGGGGVGGPAGDAGRPVIYQWSGPNNNRPWNDVVGQMSTVGLVRNLINPMNAEDFMAYGAGGHYEVDCGTNTQMYGGGCFIVIARKIVINGVINVSGRSAYSQSGTTGCSDGASGGGGGMIGLFAFDKTSNFGILNTNLLADGGGYSNGSNASYGAGPGGPGLIVGGIY